jgi:hypothetical protein
MSPATAQALLDGFLAKYLPEVALATRETLVRVRKLVPGAVEMVYDNYNFLVIGFGPTERASEAILSVVVAPKWVSIAFLQSGAVMRDPHGLLRGEGNRVRNVRLASPADVNAPAVKELIAQALRLAVKPIDPNGKRTLVIKSISAKQRPRRPSSRDA